MFWCVGQMYDSFHHDRHSFPCSLFLLFAQYDDFLDMPTKNVLSYNMRWWQSLGSCCFLWVCLALGLPLEIWICYNLNWIKEPLMLGPQEMMRRPPSLPMLHSCSGTLLSASYIPCLSFDCESLCLCLKSWGISWGLGSTSENVRMIS